ncbi:hypothetical protein GCM10025771_38790 [Niveibacterium umoris]|uniref:Uncharacterized protein n=1 Tax=Niveibacterium umoris TaxID=1193620 RepID=A0A840BH22_9RHOO|nr:hypothetical protein [Niveibacterium umoris]MBB4010919.1 hypothetical protein [Niveibacterium umoris]
MFKVSLTLTALLLCLAARADVLPPQAPDVAQRYRNNPGAFDRTDAWCEGLRVGAACLIPGTPFEGGGSGTCEREVHRRDFQIDLLCTRKPAPRIERGLPEGPWRADEQLCEVAARNAEMAQTLQSHGWLCAEPPLAADRFCKGLEAGKPCTAEVSIGADTRRFDGVCAVQRAEMGAYFQGRRTLTRPVITCEPERPAPALTLKPVSAWRKLFQ